MSIDDVVRQIKPDYVAIVNPKCHGVPTLGTAEVSEYKVEFDDGDGIIMWVTIK